MKYFFIHKNLHFKTKTESKKEIFCKQLTKKTAGKEFLIFDKEILAPIYVMLFVI